MSDGGETRRESSDARTVVEDLRRRLARAEQRTVALEAKLEDLRNRRSVRLALAIADRLGRVARLMRRAPVTGRARSAHRHRTSAQQLSEQLEARFPPSEAVGPLVSIMVVTRDGRDRLERLLRALRDMTAYRSFELVVVDNASSDSTASLLRHDWGYPVHVLRNETEVSFSAACNQAAGVGSGNYLLLLKDEVLPANSGWLGAMIAELEGHAEPGIAGTVLINSETTEDRPQWILHRGVAFDWVDGAPRPYAVEVEDALAVDLDDTVRVPAVTSTCLLVEADTYHRLGGLDARYVGDLAGIDLCLRLGLEGIDSVVVGPARLFSGNSTAVGSMPLADSHVFAARWSSDLYRVLRRDALDGRSFWSGRNTKKLAITITEDNAAAGWGDWYTGHEIGEAFAEEGWEVIYAEAHENRWRHLPADVSIVIGLLDRYDARLAPDDAVRIAWVRNWTHRWIERDWFGRYDVAVPSSGISREVLLDAGVTPSGVLPLATNPRRFSPRSPTPALQCDYTFTGNYWGASRTLADCLDVTSDERFMVFGLGWERVPQIAPYWLGPLPYERLPELYSSAKIVLDDTAVHTLPYGAMNSRVFDALACGALVITNNVAGSHELFDAELPTFSDRQSLREQLNRFLGDDDLRTETASRLRRRVLDEHTYTLRAGQMIDAAFAVIAAPRVAIKVDAGALEESEFALLHDEASALARSLRKRGWHVRLDDDGADFVRLEMLAVDVVVNVGLAAPYASKPDHVNVLWVAHDHPDLTDASCRMFDAVFAGDQQLADRLAQRVSIPVHVWPSPDAKSSRSGIRSESGAQLDARARVFAGAIEPLLCSRARLPGAQVSVTPPDDFAA